MNVIDHQYLWYDHWISRMAVKENKKLDGKKQCKFCGSEFDLSKHHDKDGHKNRHEKDDNHTIILCQTCHYYEDFNKNFECYFNSQRKRYERAMSIQGL